MFYVLLVFLHLQTQYTSIIFILLKRFLLRISICIMDSFPHSLVGKESACNVGGLGSIPGLRRASGEGKGYPFQYLQHSRIPTPVFWPREFHGLYSPWGCRVRHDWATFTLWIAGEKLFVYSKVLVAQLTNLTKPVLIGKSNICSL